MQKLIQFFIRRMFYNNTPMWCLERKTYVYLVQWEVFKTFHFRRKYFTKEELLEKGVQPKNFQTKPLTY